MADSVLDWRLPDGRRVLLNYTERNNKTMPRASSVAADNYVFGTSEGTRRFFFRYDPRENILTFINAESDETQSTDCPDTWEEAVAWLRMTAAIIG